MDTYRTKMSMQQLQTIYCFCKANSHHHLCPQMIIPIIFLPDFSFIMMKYSTIYKLIWGFKPHKLSRRNSQCILSLFSSLHFSLSFTPQPQGGPIIQNAHGMMLRFYLFSQCVIQQTQVQRSNSSKTTVKFPFTMILHQSYCMFSLPFPNKFPKLLLYTRPTCMYFGHEMKLEHVREIHGV